MRKVKNLLMLALVGSFIYACTTTTEQETTTTDSTQVLCDSSKVSCDSTCVDSAACKK